MAQFHIYNNDPTAGARDGDEITYGSNLNPLKAYNPDFYQDFTGAIKCAVRCDPGYSIQGGAHIYFDGSDTSKWQLANDNSYKGASDALANASWSSDVTVTGVGDVNTIFWAKAEIPAETLWQEDTSVELVVDDATIVGAGL